MSLDTSMVSIYPHFTIKDGKMDPLVQGSDKMLWWISVNQLTQH